MDFHEKQPHSNKVIRPINQEIVLYTLKHSYYLHTKACLTEILDSCGNFLAFKVFTIIPINFFLSSGKFKPNVILLIDALIFVLSGLGYL